MRNILLLFYFIINVFLYVLNFELFNSMTPIDLGFTTINTMPILLVLVIGLAFVGLIYWNDIANDKKSNNTILHLNDQIKLHKKDIEIMTLKHQSEEIKINVIPVENKNDKTI